MAVDKNSISLSPELHTALSLAALQNHLTVSRQLELYLRENADLQKFIEIVRAEPDVGVPPVTHRVLKELRRRKG